MYQNHQLTHCTGNQPDNSENDMYTDLEVPEAVATASARGGEPNAEMNAYLQPDIQAFAAKRILKISETKCLTRTAMLSIISDVSDLLECVLSSLKCKIDHANELHSPLTASMIDDIFASKLSKPFEGLDSFHQQPSYYRLHFNLIVSIARYFIELNL